MNVFPARARLPVRELHAEQLASPFPVDPDGHEHGLGLNHPVQPDLLVARIEDEVGVRLLQPAVGKALQQGIQAAVDPADGAGRERVAAQLLRDGLHLAGRHALDVHLRERTDQGFLRALVPVEELGREPALAVARDPQFQLPDPRHQPPTVVPRPIADAPGRPFAGLRPEGLGHVGLQHLLERLLHQSLQQLAVAADEGFDSGGLRATLGSSGHGLTPCG